MKRTYVVGSLSFYFLLILMFYLTIKLQWSREEMAWFAESDIKDSMDFINNCRERTDMNTGITKNLWSKQYKNPCFYNDGKLRCLPYFLVVGFPKCGTTDLFERISYHPDFIPPRMKELHWLSRFRFMPVFSGNKTEDNYERYRPRRVFGLQLYSKVFDDLSEDLQSSGGYPDLITADFSPSTIWDNDMYTYMHELTGGDKYYTHDFVHQLNPCMKLVIMVRDPAERLYSDYLFITGKRTAKGFHSEVKRVLQLYKRCMKLRSARDCFSDYNISRKSKIRLRIGAYSTYIADWLKVFPREQMYFIRMEDYATSTEKILTEVFNFLDMKPVSSNIMKHMLSQKPSNTRTSRGGPFEPMYNQTYDLLSQFYAPFNQNLSILLKNTDYRWHN